MRSHLLSTALCTALSFAAAQSDTTANLNLERELVQRALTYQLGEQVQLLPGKLPADLPAPLPSLPGARLIGSLVRGNTPQAGVQVFYDVPRSAAALGTELGAQLKAGGWTPFPIRGEPNTTSGFLSAGGAPRYLAYYRTDRQVTLNINLQPNGAARTQISVNLTRAPNVAAQVRASQGFPNYGGALPALTPPDGATVQQTGGGSSGSNFTFSARIGTKLSAAALLDFYATHLKTAGWTLVSKLPQGKQITSVWSFTQDGQPRVGVLAIAGEDGNYNALLSSLSLNE